ncbi:MAG TPA: AAA family ATPase [Myxococcota bacterium]
MSARTLRCPACESESPPDARLCAGCGAPLGRHCLACGGALPAAARFCPGCGAAQEAGGEPRTASPAPGGPPADGERRPLTVLFCDLVASTELGARLDPEDFRELMQRYYDAASAVIGRWGGHVAHYLGDGLLVWFGYPRAQEDDAERAVRAGLELLSVVERLAPEPVGGRRLDARVGIHTGPAVVGALGVRNEPMAIGDTANRAARIQALADPGTLLVSEDTLRLVRGIFVTEDLGRRPLKGIAEPVGLHRVIQPSGVRSRLDARTGASARFVGREQELAILLDRFEHALEGEGQTVLISGPAGVGKSRLVSALRTRLEHERYTWLECRGTSYTQGSALWPVVELLEASLLLAPEDPPNTRLRKLEDGLRRAGLALEPAAPLVAELLGIAAGDRYPPLELAPEYRRQRTLDTLARWVLGLAAIQPVILLVEDLHWFDATTLELLQRVRKEIARAPVLLVGTARPEFEPPWKLGSSWTPIVLGKLRERQARRLVEELGGGTLPEAMVARVVEKADGVPLYLEELTRSLLDAQAVAQRDGRPLDARGGLEVAIPATLSGSLHARLDRLSAAKEVAQVAATLGREFSYHLLAAVADMEEATLQAGLDRLVEADILLPRGAPPDATYTFKHVLLQDAAYESLLKRRRQQLHDRVAGALLALHDAGEVPGELLAGHLERAGRTAEAIETYRRAAMRAAESAANVEAERLLRRALDLAAELPAGVERDARELELSLLLVGVVIGAHGYASEENRLASERTVELARGLDAPDALVTGLFGLAGYHANRADLDAALVLTDEMLAAGRRTGERAHQLAAHAQSATVAFFRGEFAQAVAHARAGMERYREESDAPLAVRYGNDLAVVCCMFGAWAGCLVGEADEARAWARRGTEIAGRTRHPFSDAQAHFSAAVVHALAGEPGAARPYAEQAHAIAVELGFPLWEAGARALRAWTRAHLERDPEAPADFRAGLAGVGATGGRVGAPCLLGLLADAHRAVGQDAEALAVVDAALGAAAGQPFYDAELHRMKGELLHAAGDVAGGARELAHAIELAQQQGARGVEARAAASLAAVGGSGRAQPASSSG